MPDWSERGHVLATHNDAVVYCRVVGLGNMNNCAAFQTYSQRMRDEGYCEFVLDFSSCHGLDSTFLGILLGIVIGDRKSRAHVVVVNANPSVRRILGEVGIDRLLDVCPQEMELPEVPLKRLEDEARSPRARIGMILQAHENLCQIDNSNQDRFGRFLELLRGELAEGEDTPGKPSPNGQSGKDRTDESRGDH